MRIRNWMGKRTLKTLIAVYLCFMISLVKGGLPFYSAVAAILVMQKTQEEGNRVAFNRTIGTFIGGIYALVATFIFQSFHWVSFDWWHYLLITMGLFFIINTNVLLRMPQSVYISCVVFLSITVSHATENPYLFAVDRMLDTLTGIAVSLLVNFID